MRLPGVLRRKRGASERTDAARFVLTGDRHWGNSISYSSRDAAPPSLSEPFRVYGWSPQTPRPGDLLLIPMRSGSWLECLFDSVEPCENPRDMFFATCRSLDRYSEAKPTQERFATQLLAPLGDFNFV